MKASDEVRRKRARLGQVDRAETERAKIAQKNLLPAFSLPLPLRSRLLVVKACLVVSTTENVYVCHVVGGCTQQDLLHASTPPRSLRPRPINILIQTPQHEEHHRREQEQRRSIQPEGQDRLLLAITIRRGSTDIGA